MRDLNSTIITEKNKEKNSPIFLYAIYDYDGASNNLYFTAYDTDIVFAGVTYSRFPITHETMGENSSGQIDTVKIKVANVNRLIQGYLEDNDFRGKQVDIIMVFAEYLSSAAYKCVDTFYIDSYTADQSIVEFTLSTKFDILDVTIPHRKFIRNYCQWKFKSSECGYVGAETSCNKTKADCKNVKNNFRRFGGFPSVPQQRTYIQ